jgi:hypothetical protein
VEARALDELYTTHKAHYDQDLPAAKAVCGEENAHLASLTVLCSTLLAADATITNR